MPGVWAKSASRKRFANAVAYFHGGGFYSGSSATHRNLAAALATYAGAEVIVLDYRLAPRDMCPVQLGDTEHV